MKNLFNGIISKQDQQRKENTTESKGRSTEIIHTETKRAKKWEKLSGWDIIKGSNLCVTGVTEGEERENRTEKYSMRLWTTIFQN